MFATVTDVDWHLYREQMAVRVFNLTGKLINDSDAMDLFQEIQDAISLTEQNTKITNWVNKYITAISYTYLPSNPPVQSPITLPYK